MTRREFAMAAGAAGFAPRFWYGAQAADAKTLRLITRNDARPRPDVDDRLCPYRRNVKGVIIAPALFMWNVEKT
jgi:hypothetical protein